MAILLSESGLLRQSLLLGTDCRGDAIEHATMGLYDATATRLVPSRNSGQVFRAKQAARRKSAAHSVCRFRTRSVRPTDSLPHTACAEYEPLPHTARAQVQWRPVEALRRQVRWKVCEFGGGRGRGAVGHHLVAECRHLPQVMPRGSDLAPPGVGPGPGRRVDCRQGRASAP